MKRFSLDILIKVYDFKLHALKEKLGNIQSQAALLEEKSSEFKKKEKELFSVICAQRTKGDLSYEVHFDQYLSLLRKEILDLETRKKKISEEALKGQKELFAFMQQRKKFEKLTLRKKQKQSNNEPEF